MHFPFFFLTFTAFTNESTLMSTLCFRFERNSTATCSHSRYNAPKILVSEEGNISGETRGRRGIKNLICWDTDQL